MRHRPLLSSKTFPGLPPENRRCLKREPQAQIGGVGGLSLLNICLCLNMTGIPSLFALLSVSPFVRRPNRELELFPVAIHLSLRLLRLKEQEGGRMGRNAVEEAASGDDVGGHGHGRGVSARPSSCPPPLSSSTSDRSVLIPLGFSSLSVRQSVSLVHPAFAFIWPPISLQDRRSTLIHLLIDHLLFHCERSRMHAACRLVILGY